MSLLMAVMALPYAAPAICGAVGRMRTGMSDMPAGCTWSQGASANTDTGNTLGPTSAHCRFEQCGATVVAPVALILAELPTLPAQTFALPVPNSPAIDLSLSPPTPPPQA